VLIEILTPWRTRFKLFVFSALFLAAGVWLFLDGATVSREAVGILGIAFGGLGVAYFGVRLLFRAPVLRIDLVGITDRSSLVSAGHMRWDEIGGVKIYTFSFRTRGRTIQQRMLGVYPRAGSGAVRRANPVKRLMMRRGGRIADAPINIAESVLPFTLEELVDRMRQFCPTLDLRY